MLVDVVVFSERIVPTDCWRHTSGPMPKRSPRSVSCLCPLGAPPAYERRCAASRASEAVPMGLEGSTFTASGRNARDTVLAWVGTGVTNTTGSTMDQ